MSSQTAVTGRRTVAGSWGTRKKVSHGGEHLEQSTDLLADAQADTKTVSLLHKIIHHKEEYVNFFTN